MGPCKHSAKQKAFGTVLAWAVYFLLRRPKAPISSGGLLGASERREERGGWEGVYLKPQIHHLLSAKRKREGSESHLLGLVDTPGTRAGSSLEPHNRWGVSKACISFASERIQYWVSDPINAGSARMEARLGALQAPELLSEPPSRAKGASGNPLGKRNRSFPQLSGALPPTPPLLGPRRNRYLRDRVANALAWTPEG